MKTRKRYDSCKTCGHLNTRGQCYFDDVIEWIYFCEINQKRIEYPREMGGRDKCPCYLTKAEYKEKNKRETIENHIYPKKSDAEAIW